MTGKPYPAYKDSGHEWLGEIPDSWSSAPLKYVASHNDEVLAEGTNPATQIVYVEISDVAEATGIVGSTTLEFEQAPSRARRVLREEDVLVSTVRTYLRAIAQVPAYFEGAIASTGFAVLRARRINSSFLGFAALSESFISEVIARSVGVSYPAINSIDLVRVVVPLPSNSEQRQIADYLDAHTTKIDMLIGKQERLIETLADRRQAVISHAVTKGLDPRAPMRDAGVAWLGAIPDSWTVPRVAHHFSIVLGKMVNAGKVNEPGLLDAPYLRAGNVQPYGVDITDAKTMPMSAAELTQLSLRIGDLVVVEGGQGGYGRSALVLADLSGWGFQNHVMRVRPKSCESNAFLDYVIKTLRAAGYIASLSSHASLPSFSAEKLAAIRYGRPSISEQGAIVKYLDHETTKIDALAAKAREMIDILKERRQALISAAVAGKIDVRGLS